MDFIFQCGSTATNVALKGLGEPPQKRLLETLGGAPNQLPKPRATIYSKEGGGGFSIVFNFSNAFQFFFETLNWYSRSEGPLKIMIYTINFVI